MDVPCPPYYFEPSHAGTLVVSTASYVRHYNDWYQCLEGAYCNAPAFLGYNPPGEGDRWEDAWVRLDEGYPCNPTLEESGLGQSPAGGEGDGDEGSGGVGGGGEGFVPFKRTSKPTNGPTPRSESPSLISGAAWYDANGDGRRNTLANALTTADRAAAAQERGAGMGNLKVTLRKCDTDELLGVTYTFPRSFGSGGGEVEVVDASYLEALQDQGRDAILGGLENDGLGIGNTGGELGYYSFRILPFQIPGEFYAVFESPEGYRLSGGSGNYWEVGKAWAYDPTQPLMEKEWEKEEEEEGGNRRLQGNETEASGDYGSGDSDNDNYNNQTSAAELGAPSEEPPPPPSDVSPSDLDGPVNHSGYYARSRCLRIEESPTRLARIDVGLTRDVWPLIPAQYASVVITIRFYAMGGGRRELRRETHGRSQRGLQGNAASAGEITIVNDSLECRKYLKLKSEGIDVEDIWGCEGDGSGGPGGTVDYEDLTMTQADAFVASVKDFLDSRVSRVWTVKYVGLAHQKMTTLDGKGGRGRKRRMRTRDRDLQVANRELARLELGLRVRAEYTSDRHRGTDLSELVASSIRNGADSFLIAAKGLPAGAGGVDVRNTLRRPEDEVPQQQDQETEDVGEEGGGSEEEEVFFQGFGVEAPPPQPGIAEDASGGGMSMGILIGIVMGSAALVAVVVALVLYRRFRGKKTFGRKATKGPTMTTKKAPTGAKRGSAADEASEDGSSWDDDDDLSSRFFSDSSKFDPNTRMAELDPFGEEVGTLDGDDVGSGSDRDGSNTEGNDEGRGDSGLGRSYASGYALPDVRSSMRSSATEGTRRSRKSRGGGSMRSSGRTNQSSVSSSRTSQTSARSSRTSGTSMRSSGRTSRSSVRSSGTTSTQVSNLNSER
ncbi:hypothetical protein ACHAWF_004388 [Thalassiosira exigua]